MQTFFIAPQKTWCIAAFVSLCAVGNAQINDTIIPPKTNDRMVINPGQNQDPMVVHPGHTNDAIAVMTDTGFISKNIQDNEMEIALSKLGQERGNAAVKRIAATMIADHTAILESLRKLAAGLKTTKNNPADASQMRGLKLDKQADFNENWTSLMLAIHDDKISELEKYLGVTSNRDLRMAIGMALPKLRNHRRMLLKMPGAKLKGNTQQG